MRVKKSKRARALLQFIAVQRHSPRRIAKHPEQSGLLPQFVTTYMKADGGKNPRSAPVKFNEKNDGGRKAGSAHVNQTTGAETHDLHP